MTGIQQQNKNKRYNSIIQTAESLFLEHGLDHVQMQHIADAEGIGIATLFRYFPKKNKLIVAVAVQNLERNIQHFEEIVSADQPAVERLKRVLDHLTVKNTAEIKHSTKFREAFESYASFTKEPLEDIEDYINVQKRIADILLRIAEDGKVDGSIRADIPIKEAIITIINAYGTFGSNIALKSSISYLEDDIAPHIQQRMLMEMLLSYLRPYS
ncbi:TetR/AcrR family transcriptional regulator [Sporosarcina sp. Marseille-Q4063]|uniref:TetR/AcrR family transcriptional regulator n=1 Tax=Sporosarcina sp. Marseille-Q4063 TaxID=2810514 RepID=UPI001BB0A18D|nr:TetR/AcrR family transcriptional regulator [Sporosarcina sp. Marseille-Q4063]QUW20776.1 TetR/AcrR family transcriptional regulator [Sporosarcina sp. Marseille-Q4063]